MSNTFAESIRCRGSRLEPTRVGIRWSDGIEADSAQVEFQPDAMAPGARRVGPLELHLERNHQGDAATLAPRIVNASDAPVRVEAVVLGFRWVGAALPHLRFLKNGWQSWSFTGTRELDAAGERAFPSGPWLRGFYHAMGEPAQDRRGDGWHESDTVTVVGEGSADPASVACLVGVLETGRHFGVTYVRARGDAVDLEVEVIVESTLEPDAERSLERVRVALGEPNRLLECFAELWGSDAGARTSSPFQSGWCSWYHFFHEVSEDDLLRNLEILAREREAFPIDVVQLDDGYQRAIGDWLETNEKFPRGLPPVASDIAAAGFRPGIWTAPFCAVPESRFYEAHRDWLLDDTDGLYRGTLNPIWSPGGWTYALDTTREEVVAHLESLFRELVEMGFTYLKLDFLHVVSNLAIAYDRNATRAERLRHGLEAVRRGAGEDAFLLGCGCPLGPAVGIVDGMRIGPDVAPSWEVDQPIVIPGLEPTLPSLKSALRSTVHRAWMHRRLWLNDPDCVMARSQDTKLSAGEADTFAAATAVTGGMVIVSDDLPGLCAADRLRVQDTLRIARHVDAAGARGVARVPGLLGREADAPGWVRADTGLHPVLAALNPTDARSTQRVSSAEFGAGVARNGAQPLLGPGAVNVLEEGVALEVELDAHESALAQLRGARELAIFCDFDGTFSVQDVGATLAQMHAGDRRPALWERYDRGELTAWSYNMELLDGLALSRDSVHAFLETIELDIGARHIIEWCAKKGFHFEILSDGFDDNLDRLQVLHGIQFAYAANHLGYEDDIWRLAPGSPDPECGCGTGVCKRRAIAEHRAAYPSAFCVHIGNGRVSDLCGAAEADLVFAKDTLAPALDQRGVAYSRFETLLDVIAELDRICDIPELR